jgi:hypothetical protein
VYVDPPSYLPIQVFAQPGALKLTAVIDPKKVVRFERPPLALGQLTEVQYNGLDPLRCAGLLNVATKCQATLLSDGRSVWAHVASIQEIRQDRCFVTVGKSLYDEVASNNNFSLVSGALHHPPAGYTLVDSYKSDDAYGNLQITFFTDSREWVADIDLDDANGLGHVFQVVRNSVTGRPTHPYDIHQILLAHQHLDTRYRLHVA